jgi:hypothetical protein
MQSGARKGCLHDTAYASTEGDLVSDPFGMAEVDLKCGQKAGADGGEDDG